VNSIFCGDQSGLAKSILPGISIAQLQMDAVEPTKRSGDTGIYLTQLYGNRHPPNKSNRGKVPMTQQERERNPSDKAILIVDDEENLLLLLEKILSRQGYKVATAQNSYDALAILEADSFQLAILDIKMFPTADARNECLKKGATTYLTKPLDIQELKSTVESLLPH
jgi:CheY-like chemotaxis protein